MTSKLDEFVRDSSVLVGKEDASSEQGWTLADLNAIIRFAYVRGSDYNPIYRDANHAATTKYGCLIAPPTFLDAVRRPVSEGAYWMKDYGLAKFVTGLGFEWSDAIRVMDNLQSKLVLSDVSEGEVAGKRVAVLKSDASYWKLPHDDPVGKGWGEVTMIPLEREKDEMLVKREIHAYSEKEIEQICKDLDSVPAERGSLPLYWGEVNVGDALPQIVKPNVGVSDLTNWEVAEGRPRMNRIGNLVYKDLKKRSGYASTIPESKWPFWDNERDGVDFYGCRLNGVPQPYGSGTMIGCMASQIVTSWMGDDAFLRSLSVKVLPPPRVFMYGDTLWYKGRVVDKYKERLGGRMYRAVDVEIEATNQLKETIATGRATAYLVDPGFSVDLPIPQ